MRKRQIASVTIPAVVRSNSSLVGPNSLSEKVRSPSLDRKMSDNRQPRSYYSGKPVYKQPNAGSGSRPSRWEMPPQAVSTGFLMGPQHGMPVPAVGVAYQDPLVFLERHQEFHPASYPMPSRSLLGAPPPSVMSMAFHPVQDFQQVAYGVQSAATAAFMKTQMRSGHQVPRRYYSSRDRDSRSEGRRTRSSGGLTSDEDDDDDNQGDRILKSFKSQDPKFQLTKGDLKEITSMRRKLRRFRKWEYTQLGRVIGDSNDRKVIGDGVRIKFLNYNMLAQHLLEQHGRLYTECDRRALNYDFRKMLFFAELEEVQPDIIALQEVEQVEFDTVLEPSLFLKGYKGVYKKRTGDKKDGCAIFYNSTKFTYVDKLSVEYQQPHIPVLDRDNIALFVKLRCNKNETGISKPKTLIVGTTHILFNPKRKDVKLAQVQLMLAELDRFAFRGFDSNTMIPVYEPIMLAGDFNAEPQSGLIKFMTDAFYSIDGGSDSHHWKRSSKSGRREGAFPEYAGISDQCQHYLVVHERLKAWRKHRRDIFHPNADSETELINIKRSSLNLSVTGSESVAQATAADFLKSDDNKPKEKIETIDLTQETRTSRRSIKSSLSQSKSSVSFRTKASVEEHDKVLDELQHSGIQCTFGSPEMIHHFKFGNVYAAPLDRPDPQDMGVTTRQNCWTAVDFMFYTKIYNAKYNRITEGNIQLIRRLGLLSREEAKFLGPLPHLANSSDHYYLLAEFLLR